MSKTTRVKEELSQLETNWSRKNTYPGDVVLLLPMALHGTLKVGVYCTAELELLLPDLFLLVLGMDKVLGDASQHDGLAHPFARRTGPKTAPGTSCDLAAGAGLAERGT